jgi:hypothetical protein
VAVVGVPVLLEAMVLLQLLLVMAVQVRQVQFLKPL